jgi:ATP-binding cassette subfamily F protein 3
MLQVNRINKRFGYNQILRDVTFTLNEGEHAGLVGANGSGKTTLLEIIAGNLQPESGSVITSRGDSIGYLPQNPAAIQAETIANSMLLAINRTSPFPTKELSLRDEAEALKLLGHLGLGYLALSTPLNTLSGGEGTRVHLAALLLQHPDILLLDEPTNHLDIPALEWLEGFVNAYPGIVLLISHDRVVLDRTISTIYELDEGKEGIRKYPGTYSNYATLAALERQKAYELWKDQEAEIKRLRGDWLATAEQARQTEKSTNDSKMRRYAKKVAKKGVAKKKRLERFIESSDRIEKPMEKWSIIINFANGNHQSQQLLTTEKLSFGYGDAPLFENLDLNIRSGERVALIGANGSGKSTLLKVLLGQLAADSGTSQWGNSVVLGYMPQKQEALNLDLTPIDHIQAVKGMSLSETYHFLHYFLLDEDHAVLPTSALSFGQRARLLLARLVAQGANFLVMDEPVNHLDIPSRERFEKALEAFSGGILLVAHDRAFIAHTCSTLWELKGGTIRVDVPDASWG